MNRSRIEWCDHTWNPITGCLHNCRYCYARRLTSRFSGDIRMNKMAKKDYTVRQAADGNKDLYILEQPMFNETGMQLVYPFGFEPTYHRYRLSTLDKLKMGNNIFVGAMADIFGEWVPDEWINEIFASCERMPRHNYIFLTKNPSRLMRLLDAGIIPDGRNFWYGTTVNNTADFVPPCRAETLQKFHVKSGLNTFLSIEPLLDDLEDIALSNLHCFQWIIVGAETGKDKDKVVPEKAWIEKIIKRSESDGVPIFTKNSLIPIIGEDKMRREYPEGLMRKEVSQKLKDRLEGTCCKCNTRIRKNNLIALSARSRRGEIPKQFCFMCQPCFKGFCENLQIDMPKLDSFINVEVKK